MDTHAFNAYKIHLQKAYQEERIRTLDGAVGVAALVRSVCAGIHHVLEAKSWTEAFDYNGFRAVQGNVGRNAFAALQATEPLDIPATRPTDEELKECFPKRAKVASALEADVGGIPCRTPATASTAPSRAHCSPAVTSSLGADRGAHPLEAPSCLATRLRYDG